MRRIRQSFTGLSLTALWRTLLAATALLACLGSQAATRYPIVLMHGMSGFDRIGAVDYFYGIPQALQADGVQVHVAQVSAFNSSEARGEQLLAQVRRIVALTGTPKVHLIGHSHGSHTVRYVAAVAPELVASVTAVGGPNKGSELADFLSARLTPGTPAADALASIVNGLGRMIGFFSGKPGYEENALAGMLSLTSAGSAAFNAKFPQGVPEGCGDGPDLVNGVRYFSWTGAKVFTNPLDVVDWGLLAISPVFKGATHDGLVSVCSSRLGKALGDYSQNHLDEVNQLIGIVDWFAVSPVTLYRQHARRLQALGL
ncbi:MAG: triacylglycerol lipase [Pseudomonadota bacterium]|nr:triacylglycerol lipase [Pseudomonadota bacterium]